MITEKDLKDAIAETKITLKKALYEAFLAVESDDMDALQECMATIMPTATLVLISTELLNS